MPIVWERIPENKYESSSHLCIGDTGSASKLVSAGGPPTRAESKWKLVTKEAGVDLEALYDFGTKIMAMMNENNLDAKIREQIESTHEIRSRRKASSGHREHAYDHENIDLVKGTTCQHARRFFEYASN